MTPRTLFPDLDPHTVLAATATRWDTSGPLPVPQPGWLACPVCRHNVVQPRYWRFHTRDSAIRGRCDVSLKCTACAAVWLHGVALGNAAYARMTRGRRHPNERRIEWREARDLFTADRQDSS